jgi:hypothetical protein
VVTQKYSGVHDEVFGAECSGREVWNPHSPEIPRAVAARRVSRLKGRTPVAARDRPGNELVVIASECHCTLGGVSFGGFWELRNRCADL